VWIIQKEAKLGTPRVLPQKQCGKWYYFFGIEFEVPVIYSDDKTSRQLNQLAAQRRKE